MLPFSFFLESIIVVVLVLVVTIAWRVGYREDLRRERGFRLIEIGFFLLLLGAVVDLSDHFDSLSRFVILGRTPQQSFVEKVVGFLGGFSFLAVGLWLWLPNIGARRRAEADLRRAHEELEQRVRERTTELSQRSQELQREIREREKVQRALQIAKEVAEDASRAKSQFLASMSHELRSPLNSVIGFANVLLKNKEGRLSPEQMRYLSRIGANGEHLLTLINDILDLSKVESGKLEVNLVRLDVKELLRDTVGQMRGQIVDREVRLVLRVPPSITPFETDELKLRQVLINLISNALKFTEEGTVTVRLRSDAATLQPTSLEVIDSGIGIAKDRLPRIFDAFRQGDAGTARRYGGTGLGLSISKSLCELMGYELSVVSSLEVGSTFRVAFAAQQSSKEENLEEEIYDSQEIPILEEIRDEYLQDPQFAGRKVLVVDDSADSRILLHRLLGEMGCDVEVAASGEEGLLAAKRQLPALIVLDLNMPRMSGWEVLANLKADEALAETPVVVVSVEAKEQRGTILGALEVLRKPVETEDLLEVVERACPLGASRILVVDDEEGERKLLEAHLLSTGAQLSFAASGPAALEEMQRQRPDLILVDLIMPGMDGIAFLNDVRRDPRFHDMKVVIVTARDLSHQDSLLVEQGIMAMLQKDEDLAGSLRRVLEASFA